MATSMWGGASSGVIYKFASGSGTATPYASLGQGSEALALDANGNLFAGGASGGVFMVTTSGSVSQLSSSGHSVFGVAIDPESNVYVANFYNGGTSSYISKVTLSGSTTILANISGANGVAYSDGFLYVAATGSSAIVKLDLSNNNVSTFSLSDTTVPFSLTVDSHGTLFALDGTFPNDGTTLVSFTSSGSVATRTAAPEAFYATPAIPEPATLVLLGLGGVGLVWFRCRRV